MVSCLTFCRPKLSNQTSLTLWLPAGPNQPWWALAFLPLLRSSLLTKIGIIHAQLLQEEKIFPVMPRSEWSVWWSLEYAQKCSKSWVKNSEQNFLPHGYSMVKFACLVEAFLEVFLTASKPSRRPITAAKRKEKERKEKKFKNWKA